MTQKEVDIVFNISILLFEHPWFKEKSRTRDEVQNWVREKLAAYDILTVPCGMSWGVLCSEEHYNEYNKDYVQRNKG